MALRYLIVEHLGKRSAPSAPPPAARAAPRQGGGDSRGDMYGAAGGGGNTNARLLGEHGRSKSMSMADTRTKQEYEYARHQEYEFARHAQHHGAAGFRGQAPHRALAYTIVY